MRESGMFISGLNAGIGLTIFAVAASNAPIQASDKFIAWLCLAGACLVFYVSAKEK